MNAINYAVGLIVELGYAKQGKDKAREAGVREQLAWVAGELDKVDAATLSEEIGALLDETKSAVAGELADKPKRAAKTA